MSQSGLSQQLNIVKQSLYSLGYHEPNGAIIQDYQFITNNKQLGHADLLAFGDTQLCDISTACIAVNEFSNGLSKLPVIKDLTFVGAPIALFVLPEHVEIWPVSTNFTSELQQQEILSYEDLPGYFNARGRELSPRSLLNAKKGEKQLSLFDLDPSLMEFARDATQDILVHQFELAIQSTPLQIRKKYPKQLNRLAIWVLAARILQDKLTNYANLRTNDVLILLRSVQQLFPNYFTTLQQDLSLTGEEAAYQLYEKLSGDFTFRSLTNDMLAFFYENTLVDENIRKELGIYYTPRSIAQTILRRLPIENFPPENRTVLDGTCGSGNLLLAAYDRLSDLMPAKWSPELKHRYLLDHIWGIDQDSFACEIARLSLLLYNLPAGDSWQIRATNVFQANPEAMFGQQPHIIVGNPPFEESLDTSDKRKIQKAARVVDLYLDWLAPNGLLGIVLPLTFLHNPSTKSTREKLLRQCDVLEIWHLPEKAIPSSSISIAVILARKLSSAHIHTANILTRITEITKISPNHQNPSNQDYIRNDYVVPQAQWLSSPQWQMISSPLDHIWERFENKLSPIHPIYGGIWNGVKPGKKARSTHFSAINEEHGWKPVLYDNLGSQTLEPFQIKWYNQQKKYIKYPSQELERERNPEHFEILNKVITNATRNPSSPWRFYAAIDREQLVVTENFNYILPEIATSEELVAVLNSMVANAWFASRTYHRDVTLESLKRLPFPNFDSHQKDIIQNLVNQITSAKKHFSFPIWEIRHYTEMLDEIVFDAYNINSKERNQIREWMNHFARPGKEWEDFISRPKDIVQYRGRYWVLTGQVEAVNTDRKTIVVWIVGQSEIKEINIPPNMPGWALRPGISFQANIPWEQRYPSNLSEITWLNFQPMDYSYFSQEELVSHLEELESRKKHV